MGAEAAITDVDAARASSHRHECPCLSCGQQIIRREGPKHFHFYGHRLNLKPTFRWDKSAYKREDFSGRESSFYGNEEEFVLCFSCADKYLSEGGSTYSCEGEDEALFAAVTYHILDIKNVPFKESREWYWKGVYTNYSLGALFVTTGSPLEFEIIRTLLFSKHRIVVGTHEPYRPCPLTLMQLVTRYRNHGRL